MRVHESRHLLMRGAGIGSVFSNIFRGVVPLLRSVGRATARAARSQRGKKMLKTATQSALDAGLHVAQDALSGKKVKGSVKANAKKAATDLLDSITPAQKATSSYKKCKKKKPGKFRKRKQKKKGYDVFSDSD